jgi:hypothetical protein
VVTANQVAVSSVVTVVLVSPGPADEPEPEPLLLDELAPVTSASSP